MDREPTRNCVYQPYGSISHEHMGDRLYGVSGPKLALSKIVGLTKAEADAVCAALDALEDTRATAPTDAHWWTPLGLAQAFHATYERLAPHYGYETRAETRTFDENTPNGRLMVAVCAELLPKIATAPTDAALRRVVEAARYLRPGLEESVSDDDGECTACGAELFDGDSAEFLGLGAHYQGCQIRAFCEAMDALDAADPAPERPLACPKCGMPTGQVGCPQGCPAPAETGDDGEAGR